MSEQKLSTELQLYAGKRRPDQDPIVVIRTETICHWADDAAALEARLEATVDALNDCLSDLEWGERTLPGTNFQASILKGRAAQQEKE